MAVRESLFKHPLLKRLLIAGALLFLLSACGGSTNTAPSTPTTTAGEATQLVTFDLGIPKQALQSPTVGNVPASTSLHVVVTFKPNDALLNKIGTQTVKGTQTVDTSKLANQLGITDQQYTEIKKFFGIQGVSLQLSKLHTTLALDAPVSTFAGLLQTSFVYHQYQGRKFFAPATPILLPEAVVAHVQAITGLDSYSKPPRKKSLFSTNPALASHSAVDNSCSPLASTDNWNQVSSAYGLKQLYAQGWQGQGTTIILPEFETFPQSDLQHYLSCVHFHGKISIATVNNNPPTEPPTGEALLDLEMVAGLLPAANIVVYQEDPASDGSKFWVAMDDVLAQIASDYTKLSGPTEVSISWGNSEYFLTVGLVNAIDTQLRLISQVDQINTFVASGDCGAYDSANYPSLLDTDFPGSDRSVIAVGGTNLKVDGRGNRASEIVWSGDPKKPADCENTWGSGGGLSQTFDIPNWQTGAGVSNKYSDGHRQLPDVSAVAWTVSIYIAGKWDIDGGTSAATPIWASIYALINQGLLAQTKNFIVGGSGIFYLLAQKETAQRPFFDITQGNNLYYPATTGWDYATGWGTPNAVGIYNGLVDLMKSNS